MVVVVISNNFLSRRTENKQLKYIVTPTNNILALQKNGYGIISTKFQPLLYNIFIQFLLKSKTSGLILKYGYKVANDQYGILIIRIAQQGVLTTTVELYENNNENNPELILEKSSPNSITDGNYHKIAVKTEPMKITTFIDDAIVNVIDLPDIYPFASNSVYIGGYIDDDDDNNTPVSDDNLFDGCIKNMIIDKNENIIIKVYQLKDKQPINSKCLI